jgi:hypothetical protein
MPTLLHSPEREAIVQRLRRLRPTSQPSWGKLTAPKMVCHLADSLRVGLGDLSTQRIDTLPRRTLLKWLVVYSPVAPPRGKVQTAPEMLTSAPTNWEEDVAALEQLVARISSGSTTAVHPFFGPLTTGGWCRLSWKHLDHHLRQFGC